MADVACESDHIVRCIGEFQHRFAHDLLRRLGSESHSPVPLRWYNGKLLDDEPVQMLALDLLTRNVVEWHGVEIRQEARCVGAAVPVCGNDGQRVTHSRAWYQSGNHRASVRRRGDVLESQQVRG